MIHDSTPHRVLKISELTRHIASQLVLISRKSAVNLACACRSLEEPVLSTLWETQWSLITLLRVLPEETWESQHLKLGDDMFKVVGDPSPDDWSRVWRYASWIHQIRVGEWDLPAEETLNKLRLNSPPGGWFPALQDLSWWLTESNPPCADLFFSPHLKRISIYVSWSWDNTALPLSALPTLASIISALPTSSLERISVDTNLLAMPWAHFKDSFSSIILRCGSSFTEYNSPVPLSNAALNHLVQLPHLHIWRIHGPPPTYPTSFLPLVFPPLRELTLGDGAACGWLPFLRRLEGGASTAQCVTPLSKTKEFLKVLNIGDASGINIEASLVSTIQCFRNLVRLCVDVYCHDEDNRGECVFKLNDDNVTELATALTQLESLILGHPCFENTCLTTVACLLPISVHCSRLKELRIHFNTTNIVDDLRNILGDPRFQQLRSLPKCPLTSLNVFWTPLRLHRPDFETVAKGMVDIFPSLTDCNGIEESWTELSRQIMINLYEGSEWVPPVSRRANGTPYQTESQ